MRRPVWLISLLTLCAVLAGTLAYAADTPPEFTLTLAQQRFSPEEIRVQAGAPFILVITNKDTEDEEFEISQLRLEKIVPAGKTLRVNMPALKPGTYDFIGDYHEKTAKGRILAE